MDDSSHVRRRSSLATAVLCVAFVLVLYVLSVGPMGALHDRGVFGDWDETIVTFYIPLTWVHVKIPAIRPPLEAWVELWESLL
jgi:hypothetical protein